MRKFVLGVLVLAFSAFLILPAAFADTTSLQSVLFNVNGAQQTDFTGMNIAGFDTTTGLGTITYTSPSAPGTYFFDVFFDHSLNLPFFNEFGTVNNAGSLAAGQSYEIGDSFASTIYPDVQAGGALPNSNTLPGQVSNYHNDCVGATCNGDFAMAMGFAFTLGAGQHEVITLNLSHANPGGFSLQDTHPVDGANPTQLELFLSGSAVTQGGGPPPVPEPSSLLLAVGSVPFALVFKVLRHKLSRAV
jgi:hypothetical protein